MRKFSKKVTAGIMAAVLMASTIAGFGQTAVSKVNAQTNEAVSGQVAADSKIDVNTVSKKAPKYIFLFIGDGMSYPQVQSTAYYLGAKASNGGVETSELSFMNFPVAGSAQTFDSTSFCPDSASTATSISTGHKTYSGVINMDTTKTVAFETITEKLKKQYGYKIGVLSTVNLNHATPAAFYAHQASRKNYYEIGQELIASNFDYFAGGMTIGFAGTNYDTYLKNMENQKISYAKFDSDYVANYKKSNTPFSQVLVDIKNNFGLVTASDAASAADPKLVLTDYELNRLKTAYQRTLKVGTSSQDKMSQEEYVLYGTYEPLTVTITHILNNKSGIAFTSYSHTGLPVPVFAVGNGSALFEGYYDNTDIFDKLAALTRVK